MPETSEKVVELLGDIWSCLSQLSHSLDDAEWSLPTDCPGWSVHDQLSHIIGTESMLLGREVPGELVDPPGYVHNPIGAANERWVSRLRSMPAADLVDLFDEVTGERMEALMAMTEGDFEKPSWTPIGEGTYGDFMQIRVFDCWVHEQDIRRATDRPGNLVGPAAAHSLSRVVMALPYVVGKKAAAPQGATVMFDITGPLSRQVMVGMVGSKATVLADPPAGIDPTATLRMGSEALCCFGCGRWDPQDPGNQARLATAGDLDLANRVLTSLNFML